MSDQTRDGDALFGLVVRRWEDAAAFYDHVEPFLLRDEARHNLPFGILNYLRSGTGYSAADAIMLSVEDATGSLQLVALQTPPRNLILSVPNRASALPALARYLHTAGIPLPGVGGPSEAAAMFTGAWQLLSGQAAHPTMESLIYQLDAVTPPRPAPGQMRLATESDRALAEQWMVAFMEEAMPNESLDVAATIDRYLANDSLHLWEHEGQPVACAAAQGRTPNGIRVSYVYTPPAQRARGFASNLVAALSQKMLDSGLRHCFLFTDAANPTSNHIYQEVGYRFVDRNRAWEWE